jgi:hypothetical protein
VQRGSWSKKWLLLPAALVAGLAIEAVAMLLRPVLGGWAELAVGGAFCLAFIGWATLTGYKWTGSDDPYEH